MTAPSLLPRQDARTRRDRLEVLTALIGGPEFDPVLRGGVLKIPPTHPVYPWCCTVPDCARPRWRRYAMCWVHADQVQEAEARGVSRSEFLRAAEPLSALEAPEASMCRVCPQRPAFSLQLVLCFRHRNRWLSHLKRHPDAGEAEFERWLADQPPLPGYGECRADVCDEPAASPLGLCGAHERAYIRAGRPGLAKLPKNFFTTYERHDRPVPVTCEDQVAFRAWCRAQLPVHRTGQVNLQGLRPLPRAEFQWGMYVHGMHPIAVWHLTWVQSLADEANLQRLADGHDPHDRGLRDVWETIIVTGRRANEVIQLRLDCIGRYGGLPLLWHDQTVRHETGPARRRPRSPPHGTGTEVLIPPAQPLHGPPTVLVDRPSHVRNATASSRCSVTCPPRRRAPGRRPGRRPSRWHESWDTRH